MINVDRPRLRGRHQARAWRRPIGHGRAV